jgi:DNA-binding beta-propeller fold protein YncE
LVLFDSGSNVLAGPHTLGTGLVTRIAANADGSRFASILASSENTQLLLLDASLKQVGAFTPGIVRGVTFSRDGKYLYLSESSSVAFFVSVLDGHTAQLIGRVPDAAIQGVSPEIEDADETQLLFGPSNRGVSFIDAAAPANLPSTAPAIVAAPSLQPSEGPLAGGTSVVLAGQNFISPAQLKFGAQSAQNVTVSGPAQIQASSPSNVANGAVNLTSYFQTGWLAIAPDAFSYGPQILQLLPNDGTNAGGDSVQIYGYGFGSDPTKITVKIGGANAAVQKVEDVTSITASLGLDASYPFPLERIALQTPPGSSGKANVFVSTPAGSTTSSRSFQFLRSVQSYAKPGFFKFLLYDRKRQRIYLANNDQVDDFDLQQTTFLAPLLPPGGPPSNAGLRGLALTPDAAQLIVADFGAQNVYLLDPVKGNWLNRARRRSSRLHQLWSRARRCHKRANSFCRSQWRRRFFRGVFHMPRSDEPHGEPANHSAGPAAGSHRSDWRAACSGHGRGRSRFCCLRRRSRWSRRGLECECPESVHHFCCQCRHDRSGSFFRRQLVRLAVKGHDRNTRRRSFSHFRSYFG